MESRLSERIHPSISHRVLRRKRCRSHEKEEAKRCPPPEQFQSEWPAFFCAKEGEGPRRNPRGSAEGEERDELFRGGKTGVADERSL